MNKIFNLVDFTKLALDSIFRTILIFFNRLRISDANNLHEKINEASYVVFENYLDKQDVDEIKNHIDKILNEDPSKYAEYKIERLSSDNRIWNFPLSNNLIDKIINNSLTKDGMLSVLGHNKYSYSVMANKTIKGKFGSGGDWHRDSPFRTQFKVFIYLCNVSSEGGPLSILQGSHKLNFICKLNNFFNKKIGDYRYDHSEISRFSKKNNMQISEIIAPEGSMILANTKSLHRGKPLVKGFRYMLTIYFYEK